MKKRFGAVVAVLAAVCPGLAWGQEDEDVDLAGEEAPEGSEEPSEETGAVASDSKESVEVDEAAVADALEGVSEAPGKLYLFFGLRYRNVMIPEFVQHLFADGGEGLYAHTPGVELGIRKDGFEYQLFAQLGFYSLSDVPFKGSSDGNDAWEIIDMDYQILFLGSDFMWSSDEFSPGLSLTYGAGVGLGLVFGDLKRVQAYPPFGADPNDPYSYVRCTAQNNPNPAYCNTNNDHYGDYIEPSWANGGSSPLVFPWIAGQIGMRYKMHKNFVGHAEVGLMWTGAFVGLGAQYGL